MSEGTEDSNHEENEQFIAAIRDLRFSMHFLGIWPQTCSWDRYNVVWYLQSLGLAFIWFGVAAGLIVNMDDTDVVIDSLSLLIPMTFFFLKWITFAMQKEFIKELLHGMDKDWTNLEGNILITQNVPNCERIMARYSRIPRIFFITAVTLLMGCITFYVQDSLSSRNSSNKFLPMPHSWYPLDYDRSVNFESYIGYITVHGLYVLVQTAVKLSDSELAGRMYFLFLLLVVAQAVTSFTFSLSSISIDSFFVAATLHLCGQFRILRYFIEGITYDTMRPEYCKSKVKLMAERHQVLLRVAEVLQKAYNYLILLQLATATLTVCFLGYPFISEIEKDHVRLTVVLKTGSACGEMMLLILSYCIVGDILTNQSAAVKMAVYNARWYNCTKSINLSFVLVMIRAGKPLQLTGAKLLPMSLESFMVILKLAVSYLSVLRAVNVK